ncbi:hypothetical protein Tco_1531109 [Tanacetum coccineum]
MTSFDCRLKAIKACSACGNLHTSAFCCSKEKLKNKILVPMPESSQQHIKIERICFDCGDLLHGLNCLECDLTRKILEKAFQKFQNTSKSSNDNSNVVNAPREPFVASPPNSEPVSSKVMEIVIPEVGRIEDDILLIKDDTLREKLLNVNRLVAKIKALKDNPFHLRCSFNLEEAIVVANPSPTTPSDLSLPDYKAFYIDNDHFKEKSSGSTTTHVDFSQYDSFIFDLSNDQFPPTDRSDFYHEEFADELAQIISQPEYDCFFKDEPSAAISNGSGYQQKDRKPSQNDKTEHGMEKTVQNQGQSPKMPKSESILKNQQSNRSRN